MDHGFYMEKALKHAKEALSKNEFPVGCVIVHNNEIISSGLRKGSGKTIPNETDHAEIVALKKLSENKKVINRSELTIYCTMEPCLMCFGAIMISGIKKIVYSYEDAMGGGTNCNLSDLNPLYKNSGIEIVPDILRKKSLNLFKKFFLNPENNYWKGSFLEEYTLKQK